jgi:GcrA cell cycle regulator
MTKRIANSDWTDAKEQRLRQLWAEGMQTSAIALALGVSRNAICGKRHRLGLTPRPNPNQSRPPAPPLASAPSAPKGPPRGARARPTSSPPAGPKPPHKPATGQPRPALRPFLRDHHPTARHPCCWPMGDPASADFRYCDRESEPGRSYCLEHCRMAFQVFRPRASAA